MNLKRYIFATVLMALAPGWATAYTHLSPYAYCAGNPVNYVDPTGEDIVVLNYGNDVGHQHMAILIQADNGQWQYYSVNGDNVYNSITGEHTGGRPFDDIAVGNWDSPEEFLNSDYNVDKEDDGKTDLSVNNYGFAEGYRIKTTAEQDAIIRDKFVKISKTTYNLFWNNCATAVQESMTEAGVPVSEPSYVPASRSVATPFGMVDAFDGSLKMKCDISKVPSRAFQSIMRWNPGGQYLRKQKP